MVGWRFSHGTLVVNVLGCLIMGTVMGLIEHRQSFGHHTRILLTFGILGGFTTFSAFGYETFALLRANQYLPAMANVVLNVVACTAAVGVGWYATKAMAV
jgi:CrcB protein